MEDGRPDTDEPRPEKKLTPGAIAMLIVIPLALVVFGIDSVVLLEGDAADRAAQARPAPTAVVKTAATADAAPSASPESTARPR